MLQYYKNSLLNMDGEEGVTYINLFFSFNSTYNYLVSVTKSRVLHACTYINPKESDESNTRLQFMRGFCAFSFRYLFHDVTETLKKYAFVPL